MSLLAQYGRTRQRSDGWTWLTASSRTPSSKTDAGSEGILCITSVSGTVKSGACRMEPVRTCLGCRQRAASSTLLRCVAQDGEVVPDASGALPGRGAWVHPTFECVDSSIRRRAFGRALNASDPLDTRKLRLEFETQAGETSHQ